MDALYIYRFEIMILVHVKARSLLCYWAVRNLGISMAELSRQLKLSLSGVSLSVKRGEIIARENDYKLIEP
jgi:putative transposase